MTLRERYEAERASEHRTFAHDHSFAEWCAEQQQIEKGEYIPYFTWDWRPYLMDYNPWQRKGPQCSEV